jgi:hypothetical protein
VGYASLVPLQARFADRIFSAPSMRGAPRSKSGTGQINEALYKVLAHNFCALIQAMHAFNLHPIFCAEHPSL